MAPIAALHLCRLWIWAKFAATKQSDGLSGDEELQTGMERKQRVREGKQWIFGMLGRFLEFPMARADSLPRWAPLIQALGRQAARQLRLGSLRGNSRNVQSTVLTVCARSCRLWITHLPPPVLWLSRPATASSSVLVVSFPLSLPRLWVQPCSEAQVEVKG